MYKWPQIIIHIITVPCSVDWLILIDWSESYDLVKWCTQSEAKLFDFYLKFMLMQS